MIFYKSKAEDGRMVITGTQADARAVNKQFEQIDIPTDKAGLLAFAQRWADQEFEMNKLLDEMGAELNRLHEAEPAPAPAVQGGYTPAPGTELGSPPTGGSAVTPPPTPTISVEVQVDRDFKAEVRRRITVEEEIQNCDMPRLAVLAENVAWRYHELSKQCQPSPSSSTSSSEPPAD